MRLLTHNMLSCNIKGVTNGFPLRLEVEKFVEKEVDFNPDFLTNMFPKIEWKALVNAARTLGYGELPDEAEPSMLESDDFLKKFHHALLELHIEEGSLICPETGRRFPVSKGIPNMLLHEDEAFFETPLSLQRNHVKEDNDFEKQFWKNSSNYLPMETEKPPPWVYDVDASDGSKTKIPRSWF